MNRIGYWLSDKKIKKLNFHKFTDICKNAGLILIKIDIDQSLEPQGPFALIIHKINDIIVNAKEGNPKARQRHQRFMDYLENHPDTIILDPLENNHTLQDRHVQYQFVQECCQKSNDENCDFFIPRFVELTSTDFEENKKLMAQNNVQFPFVCKHLCSQGGVSSHKMCLVFNEEGLKDLSPPCVVQTFINHNAVLYKICMVGERFSMVRRPSIKNLAAGPTKSIFFDSNDVSKPTSHCFLNQVNENELELPLREPDLKKLEVFGQALHRRLGLSLFGIDVIIENHTGKYAVIDINTFPGYDGVADFFSNLLDLLQEKLLLSTVKTSSQEPLPKTHTGGTSATLTNLRDQQQHSKVQMHQTTVENQQQGVKTGSNQFQPPAEQVKSGCNQDSSEGVGVQQYQNDSICNNIPNYNKVVLQNHHQQPQNGSIHHHNKQYQNQSSFFIENHHNLDKQQNGCCDFIQNYISKEERFLNELNTTTTTQCDSYKHQECGGEELGGGTHGVKKVVNHSAGDHQGERCEECEDNDSALLMTAPQQIITMEEDVVAAEKSHKQSVVVENL